MTGKVLRILQVSILTVVLVFGGLLVANNFDTTATSDEHHMSIGIKAYHVGPFPFYWSFDWIHIGYKEGHT